MATISRLIAQRRNPKRVNVYLDGRYAAALDLAVVMQAGLHRGQEIGEQELASLVEADSAEKAYDRALTFISYRPRSTAEVRRNLESHGTGPDAIDEVIARLQGAGLLDDAAFAKAWVENREAFAPRGARLLGYELRQKGVGQDVIEGALPEDDSSAALDAARRKARSFHGLDYEAFRKKMLPFLQRRGFGYEAAAEATKAAWKESQEP